KGTLAEGVRYHLVGTYDGATLRIYVNGVQVASTTSSSQMVSNTQALRIGTWAGTSNFADGVLDEVFVENQALSPTQITSLYKAASGIDVTPPTVSISSPACGTPYPTPPPLPLIPHTPANLA